MRRGMPVYASRSSAGSCDLRRVLVGERTQEPPDRADADRGVLRVRRRPRPAVVLRPRHPHTRGVPVEDDAPDARRELADEPGDGVGLVRLAVHGRGERVGHGIERAHDLRVVAVARDDDERAERLLGDLGRDRCRVVSSTVGAAVNPSTPSVPRARTATVPVAMRRSRISSNELAMRSLRSTDAAASVARSAMRATIASPSAPSGTKAMPGLVQNCPLPRVNEPNRPSAISAPRASAAPRVTISGLRLESSP